MIVNALESWNINAAEKLKFSNQGQCIAISGSWENTPLGIFIFHLNSLEWHWSASKILNVHLSDVLKKKMNNLKDLFEKSHSFSV